MVIAGIRIAAWALGIPDPRAVASHAHNCSVTLTKSRVPYPFRAASGVLGRMAAERIVLSARCCLCPRIVVRNRRGSGLRRGNELFSAGIKGNTLDRSLFSCFQLRDLRGQLGSARQYCEKLPDFWRVPTRPPQELALYRKPSETNVDSSLVLVVVY